MMLVDDEGERVNIQPNPFYHHPHEERQIALHRSNNSEFIESGSVSCLHRCPSVEAKKLCVYDLPQKLKHGGEYDIGGTYGENNAADLWFYYSTSICPGYNYLLNLFVCHRRVGNLSVGVSNSNELTHTERPNEISGWSVLPRTLTWYTFKNAQADESYHIKTFCFTEKNLKSLERNTLFIPISILTNCSHSINNDVIMAIKLQHDLSGLLTKKEKTDFVLVSASGKKFPVHKIILYAHSAMLRSLIKDTETEAFINIQDNDMELLLQFLYTGTIKDISKQDCLNLLRIADRFKLQDLFLLTQYALGEQISVESAIDIALLARKYNLEKLQRRVFRFIKNNPRVMQTPSWKDLNDVELTKQLIEHIYVGWD